MSKRHDLFGTLKEFDLGDGRKGAFYSLPALEAAGVGAISKLPVSIRIVLEAVLRNYDGKKVSETNVTDLARWQSGAARTQGSSSCTTSTPVAFNSRSSALTASA